MARTDDQPADPEDDRSAAGADEPTRPRPRRRVVSRVIVGAAFLLGLLGGLLAVLPFDVTTPEGDVARCGPPAFEVLVPPDPRFDAVEDDACPQPAKARFVIGLVVLLVAAIVAALTERRVRRARRREEAAWLQGRPRRDVRARRKAGAASG